MIKEFVQNGCRFMAAVKNTDNISVFKIEVEDGVDTVILDGFQSVIIGRKAEFVFPCVTTLIIGQSVLYIDIPNEMFPNVRNVISHSEISALIMDYPAPGKTPPAKHLQKETSQVTSPTHT